MRCQSCYMEVKAPHEYGTESDGTQSADYCVHCYKRGKFTRKMSLEDAVEANVPWWRDGCKDDDEARAKIMKVFPTLKRWK